MFEKISQSAEKVVSKVSVSRRGFLGSAAKVAASVGAALAGLAAFPTETEARGSKSSHCGCPAGQKLVCFYTYSHWAPGGVPRVIRRPADANCRCPKVDSHYYLTGMRCQTT